MIGTTLGHFRIISKVADDCVAGGAIYRAEDEALRRLVFLRVFPPSFISDPDRKARYLAAARAAAAVTHPSLSATHEVGEDDGHLWVAMELAEGASLRSRLRGRPLPLLEALRVAEQVAEGLAAAHEKGLVHGGLRPESILIGAGGSAKVLGFGLARFLHEGSADVEHASQIATSPVESADAEYLSATPMCMSPEQVRGEPTDTRSDVFSLGVMMYEMVTGRQPFTGRTAVDVLKAVCGDHPASVRELNHELPAELDRIIGVCLERDPANRYQDAGEIATDLGRLRRRTESSPVAMSDSEAKPRHGKTWSVPRIALSAAAALVLATALGLAFWPGAWPSLRPAPALKPGDRVIVADFVNETSDLELGVALREVCEWEFQDRSGLAVLLRSTMADASAVDAEVAEARCRRGECEGFVTGRVAPLGEGYRLEIALRRAGAASPVLTRTIDATDGRVADALYDILEDFHARLYEAGVAPVRPVVGCRVWTGDANSVKACQAAIRATTKQATEPAEALASAQRGRELDPADPWHAYATGWMYYTLGRRKEGLPLLNEAWQRVAAAADTMLACRSTALVWEIAYLERSWGHDTQLERQNRAVQLYPEVAENWAMLGFTTLRMMGDFDSAIPHFRKAYEISPSYFRFLAVFLASAGRVAEVDPLIEDLRKRPGTDVGPREFWIASAQVDQAYVRGDSHEDILALIDRSVAGGQVPESDARGWRAEYLARAGRLREAEQWAREDAKGGAATAMKAGGGMVGGGYGLLDWLETRRTGERVRTLTVEQLDTYVAHYVGIGSLAPMSVELGAAEALREALRLVEDEHPDVRNQRVLDVWRYGHACLALLEGRPTDAIAMLEPLAREYSPVSSVIRPQQVLGRAYERAGRWSDAAKVYEATLEKGRLAVFVSDGTLPGSVFVIDQHRLAGIYERLGNTERARYWYGRFLSDWRNADPGTPEVEDAKRRLAVLGGPLVAGAS